jgi:hypothetical protein
VAVVTRKAGLLVVKEGFLYDGHTLVAKGSTVREGHPMIKGHEHLFKPADEADFELPD